MNVKLLIVLTIVLSSLLVLPVNAENYNVYNLWAYNYNNVDLIVDNQSAIMVTCMSPALQGRSYMVANTRINDKNLNGATEYEARFQGTTLQIPYNQYVDESNRKLPYYIVYASSVPQTVSYQSSLTQYNTITITFNNVDTTEYDINVDKPDNVINLGTINNSVISLSYGSYLSSVTAVNNRDNVNCIIYNMNDGYVTLDLNENTQSASFVLYGSTYLDNFDTSVTINYEYVAPIEPTIEPTAQPTPDDFSQYGEKKNFQIRNIDYLQGTQLNGANLIIYYTDSEDNIISNPVYKNVNSPAVIDLRVPKAGGLFVEYGITPNYEPVKVQTYPALNNKVGYWINQEISDYVNLYYQYYDSDNPLTDINYGITLIDGNTHLPVSNAAINIDGANTQYTSNYGGTVFKNITQGIHTFTISKQGYNTLTFTKNIVITSNIEIEFFPISVIPTATITPSPITPITPSPTISPIDKPSNIIESVSWGLAKVFGVKTVDNANYIFALLIILFPAAIAGGITHQALGFIAGGMLGFVFALTIGLIPIWTFFAMCLLAVIYIMLIRGNEGF